jgi:thiamine pyrophosphate-dependent acetolactate synthase large subunit-like protein
MSRQTGGDALAGQLAREGVEVVFAVPGVQFDWAMDGLRKVSNQIRMVGTRHEQATSYMADGYARVTGKVGVCLVEIPYASVDDPAQLEGALRDHARRGGPTLIEARVGVTPSPWHLLRLMPPQFAGGRPAPANPLGEPQRAN